MQNCALELGAKLPEEDNENNVMQIEEVGLRIVCKETNAALTYE